MVVLLGALDVAVVVGRCGCGCFCGCCCFGGCGPSVVCVIEQCGMLLVLLMVVVLLLILLFVDVGAVLKCSC